MIVILEPSVFERDAVPVSTMTVFVRMGLDSRHSIQTYPPFDEAGDHAVNQWLEARDRDLREEALLAFRVGLPASIQGLVSKVTVRVTATPNVLEWQPLGTVRVSLDRALSLLEQPLTIFTENKRNDGAMLRAAVPIDWRMEYERADKKDWLDVHSEGGLGEMTKQLENDWKGEFKRLRLLMVFDRDCDTVRLAYEPSSASNKLVEKCKNKQMVPILPIEDKDKDEPIPAPAKGAKGAYHQLQRRCMENYIPLKLLHWWYYGPYPPSKKKTLQSKRKAFDLYCGLEPLLRHHYHLKEGLNKDSKTTVPPGYQSELRSGFGDKIGDVWNEYPERVGEPVPESWFVDDGSAAELHGIVRSILEWM